MRDYVRLQTAILLRRLAFEVGHAAGAPNPESIHDLRVAVRRLNVCLRVFARFYPEKAGKRIRDRLGTLMELAGAVRNLDITLELLKEAGISPRAAVAVRIKEERRKSLGRLAREIRAWKNREFSRKWRSRLGL